RAPTPTRSRTWSWRPFARRPSWYRPRRATAGRSSTERTHSSSARCRRRPRSTENARSVGPVRLALLEERADALLRVGGGRVAGHHDLGALVRLVFVDVDLLVERALAECDHAWTEAQDLGDQMVDGGVELRCGHDLVHEAPLERGPRVDRLAGEQ